MKLFVSFFVVSLVTFATLAKADDARTAKANEAIAAYFKCHYSSRQDTRAEAEKAAEIVMQTIVGLPKEQRLLFIDDFSDKVVNYVRSPMGQNSEFKALQFYDSLLKSAKSSRNFIFATNLFIDVLGSAGIGTGVEAIDGQSQTKFTLLPGLIGSTIAFIPLAIYAYKMYQSQNTIVTAIRPLGEPYKDCKFALAN